MTMGLAAAERCDDFGWHPRGTIDRTLVAEIAQHPRLGMGHAWSRSAEYSLTTAPTRTYLVLTVEGRFEFTVDGDTVTTEPGSLILLDGEAPTTAKTLTETARFVWHLEPTVLHPKRSRFQYGEPVPTGGTATHILTTMTNALLRTPAPTSEAASRYLALAFEHSLAAVVDESVHRRRGSSAHRDGLFTAGIAGIEQHFRDPGLTVNQLCKELSVGVRTLHTAFQNMGTTPGREIERRRVAEADKLAQNRLLTPAEIATRAGFTSTRQLARALSRARAK